MMIEKSCTLIIEYLKIYTIETASLISAAAETERHRRLRENEMRDRAKSQMSGPIYSCKHKGDGQTDIWCIYQLVRFSLRLNCYRPKISKKALPVCLPGRRHPCSVKLLFGLAKLKLSLCGGPRCGTAPMPVSCSGVWTPILASSSQQYLDSGI